MRPISLLLTGLILTVGAHAQDEGEARLARIDALRTKLASGSVADVAWAAYDAGREGLVQLAPDLIAALGTVGDTTEKENEARFLARSILDALVRLETRVSSEALTPFTGVAYRMTLIIASRDPRGSTGLLLPLLDRKWSDTGWQATCNLLMKGAPAELAPRLLPLVTLSLRVDVVDPQRGVGFGGGISSGRGCGSMTRPDGFPPTALYRLERGPGKLGKVFAPGPEPISFARSERPSRSFGCGSSESHIDRGAYALDCLSALIGLDAKQRGFSTGMSMNVPWKDAADLRRRVVSERDRVRGAADGFVERLVESGLIPALEHAPIKLVLKVEDHRTDKSIPLPAF